MAIDNENKRRSVIKIFPIPDGAIAGVDRQHIAGFYRGISTLPTDSIFPINVYVYEKYIHGVQMSDGAIFGVIISESQIDNVALSESEIYNISYSESHIFSIILTDENIYEVVIT